MQRQEQDCRAFAERAGWTVVEVSTENETSAFKKRTVDLPGGGRGKRVVRPEYRRLLEALEQRRFDAMVAYDLDPIARDPRDLEDLIDVTESVGCDVRSATGSVHLNTDDGIALARMLVTMGNKASRDISRRVARRAKQRAELGEWHGGWAPFGYDLARDGERKSAAAPILDRSADAGA